MHNLPVPPIHLITHQLDCIRCNHKFPIAEDSPRRRAAQTRSQDWQALVHFHPDEHRRALYPEMNPTAHRERHRIESEPGHERHYLSRENMPLYCPRCGADNRNWLYLKTQSKRAVWRQAKIYQIIGLGFLGLFLLMFSSTIKAASGRHGQTAVFVVVLCLAGILPLFIVPNQWKSLRDYKYFRRIVPERSLSESLSPPMFTSLSLGFIFIIAIPLLLYLVLPMTVETFNYNSEQQAITKINELTVKLPQYVANVDETGLSIIITSFKDLQANLSVRDSGLPPIPEMARDQTSDWMVDVLSQTRLDLDTMDQTQLDHLMLNLSEIEDVVLGASPFNFSKMVDFLTIWLKFIGLTSLICSILALLAVNHVASSYDTHIPQPIYHSMSLMTRVGRWEANKALKAREVTRKVQWMDVQRNSIGGLYLTGLLRDMPHSPDSDKVRAQRYTVNTDRWCHIVDANITDIMAPRTVVGDSAEKRVVHPSGRARTHLRISG